MRAESSGAARSAASSAAAPSPRAVTRGESTPPQNQQQAAKVDWLNATFTAPTMSVEGFIGLLGRMLGRPLSAVQKGGLYGFDTSVQLVAGVGSRTALFGFLAYGGSEQRGRWLLQITGTGCGLVRDWMLIRALLEDLDAKITRLDLAVDFLDGEYTVDDAVSMHEAGGFTCGGRPPKTHVAGDWLDKVDGRTLYVGKAEHGKGLRAYEKGKQLGDLSSRWVRFEVQWGSRDRTIPFDALTARDDFFAGAYPALAKLIEDATAQKIDTDTKAGEISIAHLFFHLKRCYGKVLDLALTSIGAQNSDLIEAVRVCGMPRRVTLSSLEAGVKWDHVLSTMKTKEAMQ